MKFLVDQCLSPTLATLLSGAGHDAVHVAERGMERAEDPQILACLPEISADLDRGAIVVITRTSIRVRGL